MESFGAAIAANQLPAIPADCAFIIVLLTQGGKPGKMSQQPKLLGTAQNHNSLSDRSLAATVVTSHADLPMLSPQYGLHLHHLLKCTALADS